MLKNIFHNCLSLLLFLSFLFSQGSPEKRLDAKYYLVSYTKFKEGKKQEGMEIIQKYFWQADREINRKVLPFDFITGEWDHIVFFPLEDGTKELDWITSPVNAKWWKTMVKEIGSEDEVKRIRQEFDNCVMKSKQELAYMQF